MEVQDYLGDPNHIGPRTYSPDL